MSKILQIFYISAVAFLCTKSFSNTGTNNNDDIPQTYKYLNGARRSQTPDGRSSSVSTNRRSLSVSTNGESFSAWTNSQSTSPASTYSHSPALPDNLSAVGTPTLTPQTGSNGLAGFPLNNANLTLTKNPLKRTLPLSGKEDDHDLTSQEEKNSLLLSNSFSHQTVQSEHSNENSMQPSSSESPNQYAYTPRQDAPTSRSTTNVFPLGNSTSQNSEGTQNSDSLGYLTSPTDQGNISTENSVSQNADSLSYLTSRAEYKKRLLFCAASYLAYPLCNEKFKKRIEHPSEFLKKHGYITENLSPYVTVFTNEAEKKAIFAIRGTSCRYTLAATIGSFEFWNEEQYNKTLNHFLPKYLSDFYSKAVCLSMLCTSASAVFFGYNMYTQQSTPFSFMPFLFTSSVYLILKKNLIPSFLKSIYLSYVNHALEIIEQEKNELMKNDRFNDFTLTGHSLGGHVAQFVAAFDPTVKVFSISAIGGAYPNACNAQGWFKIFGKKRILQNEEAWKKRLDGLIGGKDPVAELSYGGDIKQQPVGEGDENPLAAHRLASIYKSIYADYDEFCRKIIDSSLSVLSPLCSQSSSSSSPLTDSRSSSAASSSRSQNSSGTLSPVDSTSTFNQHVPAAASSDNTQHIKKSWWKIWDWWKKNPLKTESSSAEKTYNKSLWNLYGLLRTRILDMQKIITAN